MRVTVSAPEPLILREAKPGDLFLIHTHDLADGVFALMQAGAYTAPKNHHDVICVGSRVGTGDRSHIAAGAAFSVHLDSPITLLDQVEPASFVARPVHATDAQSVTGHRTQPEPITRL